MTGNGKMYYSPGKVRDEINAGGQSMVMISRLDQNKAWMLIGNGMYVESNPQEGTDQAPSYRLVSREEIGAETVDGIQATKYKSVYESKDGKFGGFTWYTDDNIAVKGFLISETNGEKQRLKFQLTNLQRGDQDDSLFELPAGARPMDMGAMMGLSGKDAEAMQRQMEEIQAAQGEQGNQATPSAEQEGEQDDGGFVGEVADEATEAAKDETEQQTVDEVRNQVRKGIGKLFGR